MSWCREITNVFISVLTRPKFKIELVSQDDTSKFGIGRINSVIKLEDGSLFELMVSESQFAIHISCQSQFFIAPRVRNPQPMSPCRFSAKFKKEAPDKVKKKALILAKKLSMKPVFDVMKA